MENRWTADVSQDRCLLGSKNGELSPAHTNNVFFFVALRVLCHTRYFSDEDVVIYKEQTELFIWNELDLKETSFEV